MHFSDEPVEEELNRAIEFKVLEKAPVRVIRMIEGAIEEEQEGRGKVEPVLTYVVLCSPWDARLAA